jgi:hypothetical protein
MGVEIVVSVHKNNSPVGGRIGCLPEERMMEAWREERDVFSISRVVMIT